MVRPTPDPVDAMLEGWRSELPTVLYPSAELAKRALFLARVLDGVLRGELAELGLTPAEFELLVSLRRVGAPYRMKPNQVSRSLLLSTGGTTNVAHRLVARGLVVRDDDPEDARSTWLRLTPEGVAMAERAVLAATAEQDALFDGVPAEVLEAATTALRDLFAASPALRRTGSPVRSARSRA